VLWDGRFGDRMPLGAIFSVPVRTGPGDNRVSYTMVSRSFPGIKRPGHGASHPPPSSAGVKERAGLYFYPPSLPSWQFIGWTLNQHSCAVRACASSWSLLCQGGCRLMDELMDKDFILQLLFIKPPSFRKT